MTPAEFIEVERQRTARTAGRAGAFHRPVPLLGEPTPAEADPKGELVLLRARRGEGGGGEGWADVWSGLLRLGIQGQAQGPQRRARQLQPYARDLENPPLLVVSDMDRITSTPTGRTPSRAGQSSSASTTCAIPAACESCARLPRVRTAQARRSTRRTDRKAARRFGELAPAAAGRGHEPRAVAHFLNRLVFCMFAEDVRLLPDKLFTRMLAADQTQPDSSPAHSSRPVRRDGTGGGLRRSDASTGSTAACSTMPRAAARPATWR